MKKENADIICLQETKINELNDNLKIDGYELYMNHADKKGYSGTATYCEIEGIDVAAKTGTSISSPL